MFNRSSRTLVFHLSLLISNQFILGLNWIISFFFFSPNLNIDKGWDDMLLSQFNSLTVLLTSIATKILIPGAK